MAKQKDEATKLIKFKATAMWAFTNKVNEMSGKYQIDLCNLSDKAVEALENELGLESRTSDKHPEKGTFITGKSARPIFAVYPDGERCEETIGNGSKVTVVAGVYPWTFKNKKGVSLTIKKLIVTDLVEYENDVDDDEVVAADDDDEDF